MNSRVNVFIAEDNVGDLILFHEAVKEIIAVFNVFHAYNGEEFLKMLDQEATADLVFLDLNLPLKGGLDCLKAIKTSEHYRDVPVIIYTVSTDTEDIEKCFNNGAVLYIVKPHSYSSLVNLIKKAFRLLGAPKKELNRKEVFLVKEED